jgi:3-hydroxyisobutyrate dehydrogenase
VSEKETVAVLGAGGTMGRGMAANIARAGLSVRAWNRTRERAEPLTEEGAEICSSPAEAASGAAIVLTILSDADAVVECMEGPDGALSAEVADSTWLQMSTIGIDGIDRCIELADEAGMTIVDAPVLGTKKPAEDGELVVMAAGADDVRDLVEPVFEAVGKRTVWLGQAGEATRLKLAVNVWIVSVVEGAAEALALAEGLGLDPALVLDVVSGGALDLPYLQMKGKAMIERDFDPSFRLALAAKDARLAAEAAEDGGLDLPLIGAIAERMAEGASEHGDEDMAATFLTSAATGSAA